MSASTSDMLPLVASCTGGFLYSTPVHLCPCVTHIMPDSHLTFHEKCAMPSSYLFRSKFYCPTLEYYILYSMNNASWQALFFFLLQLSSQLTAKLEDNFRTATSVTADMEHQARQTITKTPLTPNTYVAGQK